MTESERAALQTEQFAAAARESWANPCTTPWDPERHGTGRGDARVIRITPEGKLALRLARFERVEKWVR